ncbi:hypothetical protein P9112_004212 [Eukaryota sp. TZLM1-RC]
MDIRIHKPTVITVDPKKSTPASASAGVSSVAPYLEHTGRVSISCYVEALKIYTSRMSNHVLTNMTRYPPSANVQTSSSFSAPLSSSRFAEHYRVELLNKEVAELRSRLSQTSESDNLLGSPSEPVTVLRKEAKSAPRRNFSSFTQPPASSDDEESCPFSSNLQSYQLGQISSEKQLHQAMLPHVFFFYSCSFIDITSDSDNDVQIVFAVMATTPNDSSASFDHLRPVTRSFSAQAVINKLFKAQQKLPDDDPFFTNSRINSQSG